MADCTSIVHPTTSSTASANCCSATRDVCRVGLHGPLRRDDWRPAPLCDAIRFAGPAVTARTLASDLAAVFKAIDVSEPGDVVVVDAHGSATPRSGREHDDLGTEPRSLWRVIDGHAATSWRFGACASAVQQGRGTQRCCHCGLWRVNVRVQCAGQAVSPGDIIIADENGVVVVPADAAADVLERTRRLLDTEHALQEKLRGGAR